MAEQRNKASDNGPKSGNMGGNSTATSSSSTGQTVNGGAVIPPNAHQGRSTSKVAGSNHVDNSTTKSRRAMMKSCKRSLCSSSRRFVHGLSGQNKHSCSNCSSGAGCGGCCCGDVEKMRNNNGEDKQSLLVQETDWKISAKFANGSRTSRGAMKSIKGKKAVDEQDRKKKSAGTGLLPKRRRSSRGRKAPGSSTKSNIIPAKGGGTIPGNRRNSKTGLNNKDASAANNAKQPVVRVEQYVPTSSLYPGPSTPSTPPDSGRGNKLLALSTSETASTSSVGSSSTTTIDATIWKQHINNEFHYFLEFGHFPSTTTNEGGGLPRSGCEQQQQQQPLKLSPNIMPSRRLFEEQRHGARGTQSVPECKEENNETSFCEIGKKGCTPPQDSTMVQPLPRNIGLDLHHHDEDGHTHPVNHHTFQNMQKSERNPHQDYDDDNDDDEDIDAVEHPENDYQIERIARAAAALDNAGMELFERGEYDRAMATYKRALRLKRRTLTYAAADGNNMGNEEWEEDAASHLQCVQSDSKEGITGTASSSTEELGGGSSVRSVGSTALRREMIMASVATSMNNIGFLHQRAGVGKASEALVAYEHSLRLKRETLGDDNLAVAKTINNIGSVYYSTGDYGDALRSYTDAYHIMRRHHGKQHLDVATVASNMGDVHHKLKEYDLAVQRYREALWIRIDLLGQKDRSVVRLLEKIAAVLAERERSMKNINAGTVNSGTERKMKDATTQYNENEGGGDGVGIDSHGAGDETGKNDNDDSSYFSSDEDDDEWSSVARGHDLAAVKSEVEYDMKWISNMRRELALDVVKEKLAILRTKRSSDEEGNILKKGNNHMEGLQIVKSGSEESQSESTAISTSRGLLSIEEATVASQSLEQSKSTDRDAALRTLQERVSRIRQRRIRQMNEKGLNALRNIPISTDVGQTLIEWNKHMDSIP